MKNDSYSQLLHPCSSTIEYKRLIITKSTATSAEQPAEPAELCATVAKRRVGVRTENAQNVLLGSSAAGKMRVKARRPSH